MMQEKLIRLLFSTRLMAFLFLVFAAAMGVGTFLEDAYGTAAARIWIYNAWWFECIMLFFMINFGGNIFRYRLFRREKWPTLLLHLSFVLILLGAGITRYISFEGVMSIREGETSNVFLSEQTYLSVFLDGKIDGVPKRRILHKPITLAQGPKNYFRIDTDYNQQKVVVEFQSFIQGAAKSFVENENEKLHLKLVESSSGKRQDHYLKSGEITSIHNILFALNKFTEGAINITTADDEYRIQSPFKGNYMRMADQKTGLLVQDSLQPLQFRSLYQIPGFQFVIPDREIRGKYQITSTKKKEKGQQDALQIKIKTGGVSKNLTLLGGKGFTNTMQKITLGGLEMYFRYGSKEIQLPFAIKLHDFIAEKYPGTQNVYKSFKSKIELIEKTNRKPYEIYMNHVLDHRGYRFFQASFDPDERGTILSVNHDSWGTNITYAGYILLYLGLLLILFVKGSRFKALEQGLQKVKLQKKNILTIALICISISAKSQNNKANPHAFTALPAKKQLDSIVRAQAVDKAHAAKFGRIIIQDERGRMKPINTFSSELVRKLSKKDTYQGLTADQVLLSMFENPWLWYNIPIIQIQRENDSIRKILGVAKSERRVALVDLIDSKGNYKLDPYLEKASTTNTPSNFEKDFLKTHEKFYLLNQALGGGILRIFPIPQDPAKKWVSAPGLQKGQFSGMDSVYTRQILSIYRQSLKNARETADYTKPDRYVTSIQNFQKRFGSTILPSEDKIDAEITLNKYNIFKSLYRYYLLSGLLLMFFLIWRIFQSNTVLAWTTKILIASIIILFGVHTLGLIARWYVSGHAPWSDAYESMIYVAWMTLAIGLAFGKRSNLTIAATTFVASIILFFAHQNWTDPAIANLQPVLDSYWVLIHVSIIVGSYGPFFVGAILGILGLLLIAFTSQSNQKKIQLTLQELVLVNEMSLTIGLVMLTIGNFLGGMWANESWGRYWGWDPKETWALISIMVYAFVIHMRLVPGLRSKWLFNLASVLAIYSVLMTYFGVNFYLKGLHSYASGDKVVTPNSIYYSISTVLVLGLLSYWKYQKYYRK